MDPMHHARIADTLSMVAGMIGCLPGESLVLMPMRGRVAHGVLRVDMPSCQLEKSGRHIPSLAPWAHSVTGILAQRQDIDGFTVLSCVDTPYGVSGGPPGRASVRALRDIAERAGLRAVLAMGIARDGWGIHEAGGYEASGPWPRSQLRGIARDAPFHRPGAEVPQDSADADAVARIRQARSLAAAAGPTDARVLLAAWGAELGQRRPDAAVEVAGRNRLYGMEPRTPFSEATAVGVLDLLRAGETPAILSDAVFGEGGAAWPMAIAWALGSGRPRGALWRPERIRSAIAALGWLHGACEGDDRVRVALCLAWLEWARGRGTSAAAWASWCREHAGGGRECDEASLLLTLAGSAVIAPWVHEPPIG